MLQKCQEGIISVLDHTILVPTAPLLFPDVLIIQAVIFIRGWTHGIMVNVPESLVTKIVNSQRRTSLASSRSAPSTGHRVEATVAANTTKSILVLVNTDSTVAWASWRSLQ